MSTNGTMFPHCDVKGEHDKPWDLEVLYLQTNQKNRPNLQVQHEQFSRDILLDLQLSDTKNTGYMSLTQLFFLDGKIKGERHGTMHNENLGRNNLMLSRDLISLAVLGDIFGDDSAHGNDWCFWFVSHRWTDRKAYVVSERSNHFNIIGINEDGAMDHPKIGRYTTWD